MRVIAQATIIGPAMMQLLWSDGTEASIDLAVTIADPAFGSLGDPSELARVEVGEWGHSVIWPSGVELGADSLWLETLSATGRDDTRAFLRWRLQHGLSLSKAASALGISRRMVAYYSNGERKLPKAILLACRGWEVSDAA
jgi:hypothetical protein